MLDVFFSGLQPSLAFAIAHDPRTCVPGGLVRRVADQAVCPAVVSEPGSLEEEEVSYFPFVRVSVCRVKGATWLQGFELPSRCIAGDLNIFSTVGLLIGVFLDCHVSLAAS